MVDDSTIRLVRNNSVHCLHCGADCQPQERICSQCGTALQPSIVPVTSVIERGPFLMSIEKSGKDTFDRDYGVLFQFLPSGECMHSSALAPLVLGRGEAAPIDGEMFDLSSLHAVRHGVSRRHCQIQRRNDCLTVSDLGSTNGTYLNGRLLHPYEPVALAHGDELVLGTLHVTVFFERNMSL